MRVHKRDPVGGGGGGWVIPYHLNTKESYSLCKVGIPKIRLQISLKLRRMGDFWGSYPFCLKLRVILCP